MKFTQALPAMAMTLCAALAPDAGFSQIQFQQVVSGLNRPVFVTPAPDGSGRLFILEQAGRILVVNANGLNPTTFLDIRNLVLSGGERGLLGLAFHPQFASNRRFFLNYTRLLNGLEQTAIVEHLASAANPNLAEPTGRVLLTYQQPQSNHNGGWIGFGPDGNLYIASGDGGGGGDPDRNGQNVNTLLGKILRINVDGGQPYSIPPGNPFAGGGGRPEIWAYGLRNPYRCSFDFATGRLFAGDVGQNAWEEIDLITGGANYGWNITEGPDCYPPGTSACNRVGLTPPIHSYGRDDGSSVTGGRVFRGPANPSLAGRYIFGDFVSGRIWALTENGPGDWSRELLADTTFLISSFGVDSTGRMLVIDYRGTIWRIADQPSPDLAVSKNALGPLIAGERGGFRIDVTNQGAVDSQGEIVLIDPLPSSLKFESATGAGWDCAQAQGEVRCTRDDPIFAGLTSSVILTLGVSSLAPAMVVNTATVSLSGDDDPSNNSGSVESDIVPRSRVPIHYAQVALGEPFTTVLLLSEVAGAPWNGMVRLRQGNDVDWLFPWSVNGEDRSGAAGFPVSLPANGAARFVLEGGGQAQEGYLEIVPEADSSSLDVAANLFYQVGAAGRLQDSTGTPSGLPGTLFALPVEFDTNTITGFAVSPFARGPAFPLRLALFDRDGVQVGESMVAYEGHLASFITEFFETLEADFVGTLRIEAEAGVYVTALRMDLGEDAFQLTSVPPVRLR